MRSMQSEAEKRLEAHVWEQGGKSLERVLCVPRVVVGVLGSEDPVFGRALELLLGEAGYEASFLRGTPSEGNWPPREVRLVLLAPGLQKRRRRELLRSLKGAPGTAEIPVFEFGIAPDAAKSGRQLPWPCRVGDLKRLLDATLSSRAQDDHPAQDGVQTAT